MPLEVTLDWVGEMMMPWLLTRSYFTCRTLLTGICIYIYDILEHTGSLSERVHRDCQHVRFPHNE